MGASPRMVVVGATTVVEPGAVRAVRGGSGGTTTVSGGGLVSMVVMMPHDRG
jgi:hypothetical protein